MENFTIVGNSYKTIKKSLLDFKIGTSLKEKVKQLFGNPQPKR